MPATVGANIRRFIGTPCGQAALIFAVLVIWRWEVLRLPPYWDCAVGLWHEAGHLADTNFDLRRHLFEERTYLLGGNVRYRISVALPLLGFAMRTMKPARVIVAYHLLTLACAAILLRVFFGMVVGPAGRGIAALLTLVLATSPLFSTQFDMLGIEVFLALCALLAARAIERTNYRGAVGWVGLAFSIKLTGLLQTCAVVVFLLLRWLFPPTDEQARTRVRNGLAWALALFAVEGCVIAWLDTSTWIRFYHHEWRVLVLFLCWFPELVVLIVVATISYIIRAMCTVMQKWDDAKTAPTLARWRASLALPIDRWPGALFTLLLVWETVYTCTNIPMLPRYMAFVVPCLYVLVAHALAASAARASSALACLGLLAFHAANYSGALLATPETCSRMKFGEAGTLLNHEGSQLECSRAYLSNHRANLATVRAIVAGGNGLPVVAGFPFTYFLTLPRFGYVDKPVPGYLADGLDTQRGPMRSVEHLLDEAPPELLVVDERTTMTQSFSAFDPPAPNSGEPLVWADHQNPPVRVYRVSVPGDYMARRAWYADRLWPRPRAFDPEPWTPQGITSYRARRFIEAGHRAEAIRQSRAALVQHPESMEIRALVERLEAGPPLPGEEW